MAMLNNIGMATSFIIRRYIYISPARPFCHSPCMQAFRCDHFCLHSCGIHGNTPINTHTEFMESFVNAHHAHVGGDIGKCENLTLGD